MKIRRFLSAFLALMLTFLLFCPTSACALEDPQIAARAALLVDAETGEVLYDKNMHSRLPPASITKVMTCLLTLEAIDAGKLSLTDEITASTTAMADLDPLGSSAGIRQGEVLTVHELLLCMMVVSANEACHILGEAVGGSISAFVTLMNTRAAELGCTNTHFVNTSGLHDDAHYTSAWDIYLITREAMRHESFMEYANTATATIEATNLSAERTLHTTNYLLDSWRALGYRNREAYGIKTGSTPEAGYCLVSSAVRADRTLISVVLGAEKVELEDGKTQVQSFSETTRLFNWGFENFSLRSLLSVDDLVTEAPVELSSETNYVVLHPERSVARILPNDLSDEDVERNIHIYTTPVNAPIAKGDVLGEITLSYDGKVLDTVPLLASSSVSASRLLVFEKQVKDFFDKTIVKVILAVLTLLIVLLVARAVVYSRGRRSRRSYAGVSSTGYRGRRRRR